MSARAHHQLSADSPEAFLFGLRARGVRPGLAPTRAALDALGAPDHAMRVVQVAGSVGKGSTAAMATAILRELGLSVALFTSPHLVRFGERFVVDGVATPRERIAWALEELRVELPWAEDPTAAAPSPEARPLTFFEWATVLACHLFREARVDVAVLEVGLGGRWDATTACKADVTAITRVDLEHTDILGDSLGEIAAEKAGVMRPDVPAFTVAQSPEVSSVLEKKALEVGAPLETIAEGSAFHDNGGTFDYRGSIVRETGLETGLVGRHQVENAALAASAVEALSYESIEPWARLPAAVRAGLRSASLPGRMEKLSPGVWLDGAHTRASIRALVDHVKESMPMGRAHFVFAALKGKPAEELLEGLRGVAASVVLTQAGGDRARDPRTLVSVLAAWGIDWRVEPDPIEAIAISRSIAGGGTVIVCGSFYLVGAVKAAMEECSVDLGDPST